MKKKVKVLIAKLGLDGHDRGAMVIAVALAQAGMEVIYTGIRQTPERVVQAAVEEDVDVIGLSSMAGAHDTLFPRVIDLLRERDRGNILVLGGGIIPSEDAMKLQDYGVKKIFGPGTDTGSIIDFIKTTVES